MNTTTHEIAADVFRFSTFVPEVSPEGFTFNQFLIRADEPLLFHCGHRAMFPQISEALRRVIDPGSLRWISFGHVEADESGAMNAWLAAAPHAQVVHGQLACDVSLNDLADRTPRPLQDGEALDLGGKRVRFFHTPHVPHGWEAGVFFEETDATLLCGDLLAHIGNGAAITQSDIVGPALASEQMFHAMSLSPNTGEVLERLAALEPRTLALMHGSSFSGDCAGACAALRPHCASSSPNRRAPGGGNGRGEQASPRSFTCQKVQPLQAGACATAAPTRWIEPSLSPAFNVPSARTRAVRSPRGQYKVAPARTWPCSRISSERHARLFAFGFSASKAAGSIGSTAFEALGRGGEIIGLALHADIIAAQAFRGGACRADAEEWIKHHITRPRGNMQHAMQQRFGLLRRMRLFAFGVFQALGP